MQEVRPTTSADPHDAVADATAGEDRGAVARAPAWSGHSAVRTVALPAGLMAGVYLVLARLASFPLSSVMRSLYVRSGMPCLLASCWKASIFCMFFCVFSCATISTLAGKN